MSCMIDLRRQIVLKRSINLRNPSIVFTVVAALTGSLLAPITGQLASLPTPRAFASPISSASIGVADKLDEYAANTSIVTDQVAAGLIAGTSSGTFDTSSGLALDLDSAYVAQSDAGGFILHAPFQNQVDYLSISNFTVMYNGDGSVAGTGEVLYSPLSETSGNIRLWLDGVLQLDRDIVEEVSLSTAGADTVFDWGVLNQCLLDAGIAQWAVTAIGVGCAVICGATLGVGCAACVAITGGIIGATAGHCVGLAMAA